MANPAAGERLTLDELRARIRGADPRALGVPPRRLRRIIRLSRRLSGLLVQVPHRKCLSIGREQLEGIVDRKDLGLSEHEELPARVMLIALPSRKQLESSAPDQSLLRIWRLLFHSRVHLALETLADRGEFSQAAIRERIDLIGQTAFDEIRAVLRQENLLLPPISDLAVYIEFAATFLELYHFDQELLARTFPTSDGLERVAQVLGHDLDAKELLESSRIEGAAEPGSHPGRRDREQPVRKPPAEITPRTIKKGKRLLARAEAKENRGNLVRAAILRSRAGSLLEPLKARKAKEASLRSLRRLVGRLQNALEAPRSVAPRWARALSPLLEPAAAEAWAPAGRLLYDLQKVCIDHEQGLSAVGLWRWLTHLGRLPLSRSLPHQREVLMSRHLHSAARRLKRLHLQEREIVHLEELLREAADQAARVVRERLRPIIRRVFDDVGFTPQNTPEIVARDKVIEELLDRIVAQGYLSIGHLRDTISRNRLKLPDVESPLTWFRGDALLRADARLAEDLDGVYRPGEIYLQALLRFSALLFGTRIGRFFTLYLALPIGGAYVILEGIQHLLIQHIEHLLGEEPIHVATPWGIATLSLYVLALIHARSWRAFTLNSLKEFWNLIRGGLYDLPRHLLRHPKLRRVLQSDTFQQAWRFILKPSLWSVIFCLPLLVARVHATQVIVTGGTLFVLVNLFLASRISGDIEELSTDWSTRLWIAIRTHVFLGFFRLLIDIFRAVLEAIDRALYTVDEWLRFRSEQGRVTLMVKAVSGMVWGVLAWCARFFVIVLLEPQVNPIKHFPVVTVSHKIMLPMVPTIIDITAYPLSFLGATFAAAIATGFTFLLPGAFGFLVWEFKENWKTFRSNSPKTLKAVPIASHGETVLRLMKPGFHSGTLPKAYAKLSRAIKKTHRGAPWDDPKRFRERIHHVEVDVRRFVEREFVAILNRHRPTRSLPIRVAAVHTGSNRIRLVLLAKSLGTEACILDFEEQSGWLVAGLSQVGWIAALDPDQGRSVRNALVGLYHLAGVRLVREQITWKLGDPGIAYDINSSGLVVWPGPGYIDEVVHPLSSTQTIASLKSRQSPTSAQGETLKLSELALSSHPIEWSRWLSCWEEGAGAQKTTLIPEYRIFPLSCEER